MSTPVPPPDQQGEEAATISREELGPATLSSLRWVSISRFGIELMSFGSAIVLARLISPNAFGRVAVTLFVVEVANSLTTQGLGASLVQRQVVLRTQIQAELALALVMGIVLTAIVEVLAVTVIGSVYGHETAPLFEVVAPVFLFAGLGAIANAVLSRQMDFRTITMSAVVAQALGLVVALVLAFAGAGAMSVIVGQVLTVLFTAVLQAYRAKLPSPAWHRDEIKEVGRFGIPAGISGITYAIQRNIDYAIVGARLGAQQAGLYWRAFTISSDYPSRVTAIMQQLALPVYSRAEHKDDVRAMRVRIVRLHATILYPCLALLAGLGPVLIPWLYGTHWRGAVLPLQLLCAATVIGILSVGVGPLLLASGMARALMVWNFLNLLVYVTMLVITVPHGIETVCLATIGTTALQVGASLYFLVHRRLGISLRELAGDAVPAAVASALAFGIAVGLRELLVNAGFAHVTVIAIGLAAGGVAYLIGVRLLSKEAADDLKLMVTTLLPGRRTRAVAGT